MSLMQLLSVSPSFTGAKPSGNPYRMKPGAPLPKFAPMGRTISLAPKPVRPLLQGEMLFAPAPASAALSGNTEVACANPIPASSVAAESASSPAADLSPRDLSSPARRPAQTQSTTPELTEAAGLRPMDSAKPSHRPGRHKKAGFFARFFRRKAERGTPVQAEFPLPAIQVVRNDLCDCDLELVKAAARGTEAEPAAAVSQPSSTADFWTRWTHRIFAPRRSQIDPV